MSPRTPLRIIGSMLCCVTTVAAIWTQPAAAAPPTRVWNEEGDAAQSIHGAQTIGVRGRLAKIHGVLGAGADVYRICVIGNRAFSATTVGGTSGQLDTQLFLFDARGYGVYANDDSRGSLRSTLPAHHALTPKSGGIYYLAISAFDSDPVSSKGLIFPSGPFQRVHGPSGPGGSAPLRAWTDQSYNGDRLKYSITLTGARACGPPR